MILCASASTSTSDHGPKTHYFQLTAPRRVLPKAQAWEENQFPHTLSIVERHRDGFRYWGWYGLNEGRGIGLVRSNDLLHWTKYIGNPLWKNARWPSVLANADHNNKNTLLFAITRDYDTSSSYIVLASSLDGIHLKEEKVLVHAVPNQRNQNPNLFFDPRSKQYFLSFYRGNDSDNFQVVSRRADSVANLSDAPEKVLLSSTTTVAAPTLLYLANKQPGTQASSGVYYLATEIYPQRYTDNAEAEWQVKVFAASEPDGDFQPTSDNPVLRGQRACLFQNIIDNRFVGFDCHLEAPDQWVLEEVEAPLP